LIKKLKNGLLILLISAAKYWPGELSFLANYAMVFAQTFVRGKNLGVYPYLVQIKDS